MDSPEHRKHDAIGYFVTQARDETVLHAERVANEHLGPREFDVWDVHTDNGRWWVISNPWNLYPHSDFKSMDVVLSFHIGLTMRVFARLAKPRPDGETRRFPETMRRIAQADDGLDEAEEAEDFQAIGMRCRECLLTFARELATDELREGEAELPLAGDFKGWAALVARKAEPRERPRSYFKSIATGAWDYVSWLTHARNAEYDDAQEALAATSHVVTTFESLLVRSGAEEDEQERCPQCDSNQVHYDVERSDDHPLALNNITTCEACGWRKVEPDEPLDAPTIERMIEYLAAPPPFAEGECITEQIDTFMTPEDFVRRHDL